MWNFKLSGRILYETEQTDVNFESHSENLTESVDLALKIIIIQDGWLKPKSAKKCQYVTNVSLSIFNLCNLFFSNL